MGQNNNININRRKSPNSYSLTIGHCKFNAKFTRDVYKKHLHKNLMYCDRKYLIECGLGCRNKNYNHHKNQQWAELFPCIVECGFEEIQFRRQIKYPILTEIVHIKWLKLTSIVLIDNKISNIEPLAFLDIPLIQKLDLEKNFITIVKPINKLHCTHLKELFINCNKVQSYESAMRIETVHIYRLYGRQACPEQIYQQGLAVLAKTKISHINAINFPQNSRIIQTKVIQVLTRKHQKTQPTIQNRHIALENQSY